MRRADGLPGAGGGQPPPEPPHSGHRGAHRRHLAAGQSHGLSQRRPHSPASGGRGMDVSQAMSSFGVLCGMTVPMLYLPTAFIGALGLVLVPKLARSTALGRKGGPAAASTSPFSPPRSSPCPPWPSWWCWDPPSASTSFEEPTVGRSTSSPPLHQRASLLLPVRPGGQPQRGKAVLRRRHLPGLRRGPAGLHLFSDGPARCGAEGLRGGSAGHVRAGRPSLLAAAQGHRPQGTAFRWCTAPPPRVPPHGPGGQPTLPRPDGQRYGRRPPPACAVSSSAACST